MRLVPATAPSGLRTCQSPNQKSNWRCSGAEHGGVAACAMPVANHRVQIQLRVMAVRMISVLTTLIYTAGSRGNGGPDGARQLCADWLSRTHGVARIAPHQASGHPH